MHWPEPSVQSLFGTNPGLNFNLDFCIISSIRFRKSNHKIVVKRLLLNFLLKLSNLKSDFTVNLGYLKPALNNQTLDSG